MKYIEKGCQFFNCVVFVFCQRFHAFTDSLHLPTPAYRPYELHSEQV